MIVIRTDVKFKHGEVKDLNYSAFPYLPDVKLLRFLKQFYANDTPVIHWSSFLKVT